MKAINLKNINTENTSIFDIQRNHKRKQSIIEISSSELYADLRIFFDFFNHEDTVSTSVWKDQDGGRHVVFQENNLSDDEQAKFRERMTDFYNNVFSTGDMCVKTTALICNSNLLACHIADMDDAVVDIMTVVSFLISYLGGYNELRVMRYLCDFIYSEN